VRLEWPAWAGTIFFQNGEPGGRAGTRHPGISVSPGCVNGITRALRRGLGPNVNQPRGPFGLGQLLLLQNVKTLRELLSRIEVPTHARGRCCSMNGVDRLSAQLPGPVHHPRHSQTTGGNHARRAPSRFKTW